jgi:hypothetical protein
MERTEIKIMWDGMSPMLNERQRRQYVATLAKAYGYGGATVVHDVTGVSLNTITVGKRDIERGQGNTAGRVRREGGGRKYVEEYYAVIRGLVRGIVDGSTYGDPERVLNRPGFSVELRSPSF